MTFINMNYELIFIDPPWGGPSYKYETKTKFSINNMSLKEVTTILRTKDKIVVWKLPFNYDLKDFKNLHRFKMYNLNRILLITFKLSSNS